MSDRLKELQRQRALLQEHLAWLDQEIARESSGLPAMPSIPAFPSTPMPVPSAAPFVSPVPVPVPVSDPAADIISRYAKEKPGNMAASAKRGCVLYFVFAMGSLVICAIGAYLIYVQMHAE